jgi:hypothetical protein
MVLMYSLRRVRLELIKERTQLEDQIAVIQVQAESKQRYKHRID